MENRKNNYSSCNRVDDFALLEILRENEQSCRGRQDGSSRRASCGCNVNSVKNENYPNTWRRCFTTDSSRRVCRTERNASCTARENLGGGGNVNGNEIGRISRLNSENTISRSYNYNDGLYNAVREESVTEGSCNENCISNSCINNYSPAMVYCPDHDFSELYECEEALERGTLFRVLDLVFYPTRCNNCR